MSNPSDSLVSAEVSRRQIGKIVGVGATLTAAAVAAPADAAAAAPRRPSRRGRAWRAGDHHIHSEWSVGWDEKVSPPAPIKGGDAIYPIVTNASYAKLFGLQWVMCTDHGGPNHSKVNLEQAYPELLRSRKIVPEVLQFWGMEFDAPAMDHHTLMIPRRDDEARVLYELERSFNSRDAFPSDPGRNTEAKMVEFLKAADLRHPKPLVIAHHAARSAKGQFQWGLDTPHEFRNNQDAASSVYVGFEGAPGHQAGPLDGGARGGYSNHPTYGGYDQMTAIVGGLWDSLLGEGRKWWITATSDSHVHWTRGGSDFWPGEYSKTYVHAAQQYDDIMDGIRSGRIFTVTGDLVSALDLTVGQGRRSAASGETITLTRRRDEVVVEVRFTPRTEANANGDVPHVNRVDIITGDITGPAKDRDIDRNPSAKVVGRYGTSDFRRDGRQLVVRHRVRDADRDFYVRVRGTSTDEMEPVADGLESPWDDLWFYSNPVFVKAARG